MNKNGWNPLCIRILNLISHLSSKHFHYFEEKCKNFLVKIRKESCFRNYFIHFWAKNHVVRKSLQCRLHPLSSLLRRHIFSLFCGTITYFSWYSTSTTLRSLLNKQAALSKQSGIFWKIVKRTGYIKQAGWKLHCFFFW